MKNLLLVAVATLLSLFAHSQTFTMKGVVQDSNANPIFAATIKLMQDSAVITGAVADVNGAFELNVKSAGRYGLLIEKIGYDDYFKVINIPEDGGFHKIVLSPGAHTISVIEIQARVGIGVTKGDTSEYNASAFKTGQNASAKDLVTKVPGVKSVDGQVQAEGENVQQILVDGKPFFGQDINTALGVLPAQVVDKIQVFDDQSEQSKASGVDDGTRVKTINIVTKINMRNGEFGKVYGGYGTENHFNTGGNINMFRGQKRITLLGQFNNINIQNFSTSDLLGVIADNSAGGHGHRGPSFMRGFSVGGDASDFMVNPQNGVINTLAGGLNYQDAWGKKFEISASYFVNNAVNTSITNTYRLFYLDSLDGQSYEENDSSNAANLNHRLNGKMVYKFSETASLYMLPTLSAQFNVGDQTVFGQTSFENLVQSQINNIFNSNYTSLYWGNDVMFRKRFAKEGRSLFVQGRVNQALSKGNNDLNSYDMLFDPLISQRAEMNKVGIDLTGSVMYSEPLGTKGQNLFFTYDVSNAQTNYDNDVFNDRENGALDSLLTNRYHHDWVNQSVGAGIRKFNQTFGYVVRVKYEYALMANDQEFGTDVDRSFTNVLPFGLIRWAPKPTSSVFMMYRTYTAEPSARQLQENIDNSNPLVLSTGNSELVQQYNHYFRLRYKATNKKKTAVFFAGTRVNVSNSFIGDASNIAIQDEWINGYLLTKGSQLRSFANLDGYYSVNNMVNYGFQVKKLKSNLNVDLSNTVSQIPSVVNGVEAKSVNNLSEFGIVLSSNISENIDFTIGSNTGYSKGTNSLNEMLNNEYYIQRSSVKFDWVMPYGVTLRTIFEHQQYFGLNNSFDNKVLLLNAGIGKQVFADKRGEIQLSVFDLLGQNNQISQQFYSNYFEEGSSNVLTRYVMLNFSYNIRKFREGNIPEVNKEEHMHGPPHKRP